MASLYRIWIMLALTLLLPFAAEAFLLAEKTGNHTGEEKFLSYRIEYLIPKGVTYVDGTGITYAPFGFSSSHEATILPERYFGDYPLYFSNTTLRFAIHMKNTGKRTYRNLEIIAVQEFLNEDGGTGTSFPEPNFNTWFIEILGPGEELTLFGIAKIPRGAPSGIDQTHLQIIHHTPNTREELEKEGTIIVDDPQAGLWCPVAEIL